MRRRVDECTDAHLDRLIARCNRLTDANLDTYDIPEAQRWQGHGRELLFGDDASSNNAYAELNAALGRPMSELVPGMPE